MTADGGRPRKEGYEGSTKARWEKVCCLASDTRRLRHFHIENGLGGNLVRGGNQPARFSLILGSQALAMPGLIFLGVEHRVRSFSRTACRICPGIQRSPLPRRNFASQNELRVQGSIGRASQGRASAWTKRHHQERRGLLRDAFASPTDYRTD